MTNRKGRHKNIKLELLVIASLIFFALFLCYVIKTLLSDNSALTSNMEPGSITDAIDGTVNADSSISSAKSGSRLEESQIPQENNNTKDTANANTDNAVKIEVNKGQLNGFFENAVFIGDSITEGLFIFDLLDESSVVASKGLTVLKAQSMVDAAAAAKPSRIYILLGLNDLLYEISSDQFIENYGSLIKQLKLQLPACQIYIQSILPVTREVEEERPLLGKENINKFNFSLKSAADTLGAKFIDTASIFVGKDGYIEKQYTPDGIHIDQEYYGMWLQFLMENSI